MTMRACGTCGQPFTMRRATSRFCSYSCAIRDQVAHRDYTGSRNPKWKGGVSKHPLHAIFTEMIGRCERPSHPRWESYGGRGITVCKEWRHDFWAFVRDVGPRPEGVGPTGRSLYSLDRIDNDGNYEPGNVRWATQSEQSLNRRRYTRKDRHANA